MIERVVAHQVPIGKNFFKHIRKFFDVVAYTKECRFCVEGPQCVEHKFCAARKGPVIESQVNNFFIG